MRLPLRRGPATPRAASPRDVAPWQRRLRCQARKQRSRVPERRTPTRREWPTARRSRNLRLRAPTPSRAAQPPRRPAPCSLRRQPDTSTEARSICARWRRCATSVDCVSTLAPGPPGDRPDRRWPYCTVESMLLLLILVAASPPLDSPRPLLPHEFVGTSGPFRPQSGAWVEYLVRSRGEQDVRVRLAVLPPVAGDGRAWIEVTTVGARSLPFAARLLLNVATGKLERASVYALGQAPIELPVGEADGATRAAAPLVRVVNAHAKAIRVAAGTFTATELHVGQGGAAARVWRSNEVT